MRTPSALWPQEHLERLELIPWNAKATHRYKTVVAKPAAMDALRVDRFVEAHTEPPQRVWLDLDATDDRCTDTSARTPAGAVLPRLLRALLLLAAL